LANSGGRGHFLTQRVSFDKLEKKGLVCALSGKGNYRPEKGNNHEALFGMGAQGRELFPSSKKKNRRRVGHGETLRQRKSQKSQ